MSDIDYKKLEIDIYETEVEGKLRREYTLRRLEECSEREREIYKVKYKCSVIRECIILSEMEVSLENNNMFLVMFAAPTGDPFMKKILFRKEQEAHQWIIEYLKNIRQMDIERYDG